MAEKMDPTVKKKWVNALRSGKYIQGRGTLHSLDDRFCCLGVLCHLAYLEGKVSRVASNTYQYGDTRATSFLPLEVQEWAGLSQSNPDLGTGRWTDDRYACNVNDNGGYRLYEIADLIEENL